MLIGIVVNNSIMLVSRVNTLLGEGYSMLRSVLQTGTDRLRPIMMTSFAFVMGVVPLVVASGAGAEMRQSLGTAVFFGMLGVTMFGLIFTPVFYIVCRALAQRWQRPAELGSELGSESYIGSAARTKPDDRPDI